MRLGTKIKFEWDKWNKNKSFRKHKVTVKEAEEVFHDSKKIILSDIKHSDTENRYILMGKTGKKRLLYTIFTIREEKIRIISSRDANRKEVPYYEKKANTT